MLIGKKSRQKVLVTVTVTVYFNVETKRRHHILFYTSVGCNSYDVENSAARSHATSWDMARAPLPLLVAWPLQL